MRPGVKRMVLDHLMRYRADSSTAIAKAIGQPRQRVSVALSYLKNCGVVDKTTHRKEIVWTLLTPS